MHAASHLIKVLIQGILKGASDKKTFVWTKEAFKEKSSKVTESDSRYFLITKNPICEGPFLGRLESWGPC